MSTPHFIKMAIEIAFYLPRPHYCREKRANLYAIKTILVA
jgi:hypothetical protein